MRGVKNKVYEASELRTLLRALANYLKEKQVEHFIVKGSYYSLPDGIRQVIKKLKEDKNAGD